MTQVNLQDTYLFDAADVRPTADGYLVASPRVARTGVQVYKGSEVGMADRETVRVYRPEKEVFHKDALSSIANKPLTLGHPKVPVTSKNWKEYSVGSIGEAVIRDGEFVRVPMLVMDSAAISRINNGERQLSLGYTAELNDEAGTTPDGQPYDMSISNIRVNHAAFCKKARGGDYLAFGDTDPDEPGAEPMKKFIVDSITVEAAERDAEIIQREFTRLNDAIGSGKATLTAAQTELATVKQQLADANTAVETAKGEAVVLKKQLEDSALTPAKLDEAVKARSDIIGRAKTVLGDTFDATGKTDVQIKRDAVTKFIGDAAAVTAMSDEAINGAFLAIKPGTSTTNVQPGGFRLADHLSGPSQVNLSDSAAAADAAWDKRGKTMADAWRTN
ncbi:MAG: hypothetical protein JWN75_1164 [Candidatus Saccharibacteria bacterium]|nr:hypothetical protein [Candidatus Saccharibacteria bacterium]